MGAQTKIGSPQSIFKLIHDYILILHFMPIEVGSKLIGYGWILPEDVFCWVAIFEYLLGLEGSEKQHTELNNII